MERYLSGGGGLKALSPSQIILVVGYEIPPHPPPAHKRFSRQIALGKLLRSCFSCAPIPVYNALERLISGCFPDALGRMRDGCSELVFMSSKVSNTAVVWIKSAYIAYPMFIQAHPISREQYPGRPLTFQRNIPPRLVVRNTQSSSSAFTFKFVFVSCCLSVVKPSHVHSLDHEGHVPLQGRRPLGPPSGDRGVPSPAIRGHLAQALHLLRGGRRPVRPVGHSEHRPRGPGVQRRRGVMMFRRYGYWVVLRVGSCHYCRLQRR